MDKQGPDFICIGAQKAGTSWLYYTLKEHPDIEFPGEKEVHFWDMHYERGVKWYSELFRDQDHITGDITPAYAILDIEKIQEIKSLNPDIKIIYILRNPIERAWSHAKMDAMNIIRENKTGVPFTFNDLNDSFFLKHFDTEESLLRGDYATCITNWMKIFNKEQIKIMFFEDIQNNPKKFILGVTNFIGTDKEYFVNKADEWFTKTQNEGTVKPLTTHLRQQLIGIYKEKIDRTSAIINKDLSMWYCNDLDNMKLNENSKMTASDKYSENSNKMSFEEISKIQSKVHKKGYGSISAGDALFLQDMIYLSKPKLFLEVGTASGISTGFIALFMHNIGGKQLISIDPSTTFYVDRSKTIGFLADKIYKKEDVDIQFLNISGSWCLHEDNNENQKYYDCAFIDANHQHPWPTLDTIAVAPLIKPGGLMAHHDLSLFKKQQFRTGIGPKYLYDQIDPILRFASDISYGENIYYIKLPNDYSELENSIINSLCLPWSTKNRINNNVLTKFKKIIERYWSDNLLLALEEATTIFNNK